MGESPIKFDYLYDALFTVLEWVSNFFEVLQSPIKDWIQVDLGVVGDNVVLGWLEEVLNWVLDIFLDTKFADWTILEFCFGSGLTFILMISLARFLLTRLR